MVLCCEVMDSGSLAQEMPVGLVRILLIIARFCLFNLLCFNDSSGPTNSNCMTVLFLLFPPWDWSWSVLVCIRVFLM